MKLTNSYRSFLFKFLTVVSLLSSHGTYAKAEGGSRDGGGGLGVGNFLLDNYEDSNGGIDLKSFDPSKTLAFRALLEPRLRKLDLHIPGIYDEITSGLTEKKWFFTNSKIKPSNDACLLIEVKTIQIAKQDLKSVVISQAWYNNRKIKNKKVLLENQEALLLHELVTALYNKLHGRNENCSTHIRDTVRLILNAEAMPESEVRDKLVELGFPRHATKLEMEKILRALSPVIDLGCSVKPPERESSKLAYDALVQFRENEEAYKAFNYSEDDTPFLLGHMRLSLGNLNTTLSLYSQDSNEKNGSDKFYEIQYRIHACEALKKWISRHTSKFSQ